MRLSVIVPTYRVGGLDVLLESLAHQTHRDFEVLIPDELYERRLPMVAPHLDRYRARGLDVRMIAPDGGPRLSNYSRSINNAVARATGEVVVMQADYTWLSPECLERHVELQELTNGACVMLDVHNTALPPLHRRFKPPQGPDWEAVPYPTDEQRRAFEAQMNVAADAYEVDLAAGRYDEFMFSIFEAQGYLVSSLPILRSHVKSDQDPNSFDPNWCSLKNESIPIEAFLKVNGLDEDMDGCHLYQDQEFAWRAHHAGYRWVGGSGGEAYIVNPRSVLYAKRLSRPMMSNGDEMKRKQATGAAVNPHRNLRAEHAAWSSNAGTACSGLKS